ncbi:MAG: hypothetical protein P8M53_05305, partial [Pirellulales bacterium]|nr:hypothetical protein [Pirellulales bacterium]
MLTHSDHRRRVTRKTARTGLTLIEILMTIFVLAVGLLGVAALMPVGSYQMQRGQIAQRVSEIGPAALDFIESTSMHSPDKWGSSGNFDQVDPNTGTRNAYRGTLDTGTAEAKKHVIEFVRSEDSAKLGTYHQPGIGISSNDVCVVRRCEPFAIDPLYIYRDTGSTDTTDFVPADSMPRITLHGVTTAEIAEVIFQNDEDLTVVEDETGMTSGRAVHGSWVNPEKAKSEGNYSWLATLAPGEIDSGSDPRYWTVSVAVFYKRPLGLQDDAGNNLSQWTVPFSTSGGNNGYTTVTLLPTSSNQIFEGNGTNFDQEAGDSMRIKRRMWGLVTFTDDGHKRARWYRVGTVQKPPNGSDPVIDPIMIRLIGPDLP